VADFRPHRAPGPASGPPWWFGGVLPTAERRRSRQRSPVGPVRNRREESRPQHRHRESNVVWGRRHPWKGNGITQEWAIRDPLGTMAAGSSGRPACARRFGATGWRCQKPEMGAMASRSLPQKCSTFAPLLGTRRWSTPGAGDHRPFAIGLSRRWRDCERASNPSPAGITAGTARLPLYDGISEAPNLMGGIVPTTPMSTRSCVPESGAKDRTGAAN
jgi:hypothetical protein